MSERSVKIVDQPAGDFHFAEPKLPSAGGAPKAKEPALTNM